MGRVPVVPPSMGSPVQLVRVPLDGVPRAGVTRVGDVANTKAPVPVSSVIAAKRFALDGVARNVATPDPRPAIPVETGNPVQLVRIPLDGVPSAGVTKVGLVAKTRAPEPVSSVMAVLKLALDGVAKNVATPEPRPEMPEPTGSPVQLVNVPLAGVPRVGVTSVGLVANTSAPDPVSSVTAAARLALDGVVRKVCTPVAAVDSTGTELNVRTLEAFTDKSRLLVLAWLRQLTACVLPRRKTPAVAGVLRLA
jgi:hypothetical protein